MCFDLAKDGVNVIFFDHSHPFDEDAQPGTNEKNSDDDDKFIGEMRKTKGGKDTIFNIRVSPHKACKKQ